MRKSTASVGNVLLVSYHMACFKLHAIYKLINDSFSLLLLLMLLVHGIGIEIGTV